MKQRGGIELTTSLAIPGLLDNATFRFAVTPPATLLGIPDFAASAHVANLRLPGLQVTEANVQIMKNGNQVTIHVDGEAIVLASACAWSATSTRT